MLDFPSYFAQYRSEARWATVSRVRGDTWRESLPTSARGYSRHMQLVRGVSSEPGIWHSVTVTVSRSGEVAVSIDGRALESVVTAPEDKVGLVPGYIGLASYEMLSPGQPKVYFRNVTVSGRPQPHSAAFNLSAKTRLPWNDILGDNSTGPMAKRCTTTAVGCWCSSGRVIKAPNGDLLAVPTNPGMPNTPPTPGSAWAQIRSVDGARWAVDRSKPPMWGACNTIRARSDGVLQAFDFVATSFSHNRGWGNDFRLQTAVSHSNGRTWSAASLVPEAQGGKFILGPEFVGKFPELTGWVDPCRPNQTAYPNCPVNSTYNMMGGTVVTLRDNATVLLFAVVNAKTAYERVGDRWYVTATDPVTNKTQPPIGINLVLRSTDDGECQRSIENRQRLAKGPFRVYIR